MHRSIILNYFTSRYCVKTSIVYYYYYISRNLFHFSHLYHNIPMHFENLTYKSLNFFTQTTPLDSLGHNKSGVFCMSNTQKFFYQVRATPLMMQIIMGHAQTGLPYKSCLQDKFRISLKKQV